VEELAHKVEPKRAPHDLCWPGLDQTPAC